MVLKKTGAKTASRAPKLGYFDGQTPQLSARVNHRTPTAGVIGHNRLPSSKPLYTKQSLSEAAFFYIVNAKNHLKVIVTEILIVKGGGGLQIGFGPLIIGYICNFLI